MKPTKTRLPRLLFFLFMFPFSVVNAQRIVNLVPVPFPVNSSVDPSVNIFTNPASDTACIFATTEWNTAGYIINKEQKLVQQFSFQKKDRRDKVFSAFFTNGTIVFLVGHDNQITEYVYRFANHLVESAELSIGAKKELLMTLINAKNALYLMSCVKDNSVLVLRTLSGFGQIKVDSIQINTNNDHSFFGQSFYETITTNHDSKKFLNYAYISSESPDAETLIKDCKIYYQNDSIYIALNGFVKDVLLISFDPKEPKVVYQKVNTAVLSGCKMDIFNSRFNSYLLHDRLYTISACETQMTAEAFDIKTGARQFVETTNSNEEISYANTPIIQSVTDIKNGPHADRELTTKQLLHKMLDGNAVIKAEENNHDIALTVGSYKTFAPLRGNVLDALFIDWASILAFTLSNSVLNENNERITRFVSVWDKNSFAHRQGLSEIPLEDKLDKFKQNVRTFRNCEALYKMNGSDWYLYYNPNTQAITIILL